MAINLFRHDPPKWADAIAETYKEAKELKNGSCKKKLVELVKKQGKVSPISFDDAANAACRINNFAVVAKAER